MSRINPIRARRAALGLTQAALARAVGVSRQTINAIEGADYAPSVFLALRIASQLQTTVEELFSVDVPVTGDTKRKDG